MLVLEFVLTILGFVSLSIPHILGKSTGSNYIFIFKSCISSDNVSPGAEIILLCLEVHVVSSCVVLCSPDSNLSQKKPKFLYHSYFSCSRLVYVNTAFLAFAARICLGRQNNKQSDSIFVKFMIVALFSQS